MKKFHQPFHPNHAIIIIFFLALCIASVFVWIARNAAPGAVAQNIIGEVNASENAACQIDLKAVTDFEWDRVVVASADFFAAGYSAETIEDMWGVDYDPQSEYRARLIFISDDKVVHEESYAASVEEPSEFNISVSPNLDYFRILSRDNATILVEKSSSGYSLVIDK